MSYLKTEAVVLRRYPFGESSQVLSLMTRDYGRLRVLAKGAHRPKSSFGGPLDLAQRIEAVYWPKPPGQLDLLTASDLIEGYPGLRRSWRRITAACCALELVDGLSPEGDPLPGVYELLVRLLEAAASASPAADPDLALLRFGARLLQETGFFPRTSVCALCQKPLPLVPGRVDPSTRPGAGGPAPRIPFSARHGGTLCPSCPGRDGSRLFAGAGTLALLEVFGRGPEARAETVRPAPEQADQLRALLNYLFAHLLEREPRTFRFLRMEFPVPGSTFPAAETGTAAEARRPGREGDGAEGKAPIQ